MKDLTGKYCIVTGAGKGIGKAIAKRFLEEQAAGVAILEWNLELAEATAKELDPTGKKVIAVKCNVADSAQVKEAIDTVVAAFGQIDVLVNNAGITRDRIFHKMTDDEWNAVIDVNLNGVYNTCKFVVPMMRDRMSGSIINISSTSLMGNPGQANYAATKAALQGFTRTVAKELARKNVRMNCVAPAYVDTEMMRAVGEEKLNAMISRSPAQRMCDPAEIAAVVAFLATEDASWVTGQTIFASGGSTCS
jgi:3-oxoacyl-[acyl-carrier protein] reductase